ncbi:MAG: bifunctional methylenetetrahydrofolate dehydrogenase/methenyltetrahydrofolate cyclohydrolase FolD [Lentisphaeria bacterium]|nr:bifunctional methylenetetrahydrofolate dehydrogenase/methenyltetrahydrofolate cyclohydrolase FolD [Lentisphaeria bacterium]
MAAPLIIDGKTVAASVHAKSVEQIAEIKEKYGTVPGLAVILVGENPASQVYVGTKVKKCAELGIYSEKIVLPESTTQEELLAVIDRLNKDPRIHGILVQSPPPKQINEEEVVLAIDPAKDVDCFHPFNAGKLFLGDTTGFMPCTPYGVMKLLEYYQIPTRGKHAVVLGRSNIVGKPMAALLSNKGVDATVTVAHSRTENLKELLQSADILVAAIGKPEFVKADMVKPGAVVIDVGINRIPDETSPKGYRIVGDVDFAEVSKVASAITPVPGGVGPMTIAMLMQNAIRGFFNQ